MIKKTASPKVVPHPTEAIPPGATSSAPISKIATVLGLLQRTEGATLGEIVEVTGWLPHTTRAALTGLRKKGHQIIRGKRGDVTCYAIAAAA